MGNELRRQRGRHADPLTRIIMAAGFNQDAMLDMLQNYVENQCNVAREDGKSQSAESVCMGLHAGPPTMMCGACAEAERTVPTMLSVQAEIDANKKEG